MYSYSTINFWSLHFKVAYNISYMLSFNKAVYIVIAFLVIVLTKEDPTIILSLFMVAIFAC